MHQVKLNENEKYSLASFIISNDKIQFMILVLFNCNNLVYTLVIYWNDVKHILVYCTFLM